MVASQTLAELVRRGAFSRRSDTVLTRLGSGLFGQQLQGESHSLHAVHGGLIGALLQFVNLVHGRSRSCTIHIGLVDEVEDEITPLPFGSGLDNIHRLTQIAVFPVVFCSRAINFCVGFRSAKMLPMVEIQFVTLLVSESAGGQDLTSRRKYSKLLSVDITIATPCVDHQYSSPTRCVVGVHRGFRMPFVQFTSL